MTDITELAQGMDREAVKYIRGLKSKPEDELQSELTCLLEDRNDVGEYIELFNSMLPMALQITLMSVFTKMHMAETRIALVLSERERRDND